VCEIKRNKKETKKKQRKKQRKKRKKRKKKRENIEKERTIQTKNEINLARTGLYPGKIQQACRHSDGQVVPHTFVKKNGRV